MVDIVKPDISSVWAEAGAVIAPSNEKIKLGWTSEVPPHQYENYVQNRQDEMLAYLNQKGVPEWRTGTEYFLGKSFVQDAGKIYKANKNSGGLLPNQKPSTDATNEYWEQATFSLSDLKQAVGTSTKDVMSQKAVTDALGEVTEALGQVQVQGAASWSADGAPYPINAQVYHNGKQWISLRANSVQPVDGADWKAIGTAATANLTTSNTDGTSGRVLKVGDGGWMGQGAFQSTPYGYPTSVNDVTNQTKVIRSNYSDNGINSFTSGIHFAAENTWGRLRVLHTSPAAWIQGGLSTSGTGWTSQVVLSGNLLQTTGSSTTFPMSQKAVTDALGVFGQPSMTGSATLNGTTDNTVQLTAIVTTLVLEVGDVIRIQYSGYDKLHTVESITNNNSIIVNYEHSGNRGNGSLKLADQTATVTIKRIAKWYNAPIGLGQAWVNVTAKRSLNTQYASPSNRSFGVHITTETPSDYTTYTLTVDGENAVTYNSSFVNGLNFAVINVSNNYKYAAGSGTYLKWQELR